MPRRISPSQLRSQFRQLQQKQKRAINEYNQAVRKHNNEVKRAVSKAKQDINRYNTAVRAHNNRVRANRDRLRRELQKLANTQRSTRFIEYRPTVNAVQSTFERLEDQFETGDLDGRYDEVLDLSEREAANNVTLMNALAGESDENTVPAPSAQPWLLEFLAGISADLSDRWRGALFALNPANPDAARHFCTSAREVITQILETKAPDQIVFATMPDCQTTQRGNPTRRARIGYFLQRRGLSNQQLEEFVEQDVDAVVKLFEVFNRGTHGAVGAFNQGQLIALRQRVEDAIAFLSKVVGDDAPVAT